jgi:uncharacterized protein YhfF
MDPPRPATLNRYLPWLRAAGIPLPNPLYFLMFGDEPALVRELAELVARGPKRATTSLPEVWTGLGEALPCVGDVYLVHDWEGAPLALVQNTRVELMALRDVDADYARDEGEGDGSLAYWRESHWAYFSREAPRLGVPLSWDTLVVCQRFRRLFPA